MPLLSHYPLLLGSRYSLSLQVLSPFSCGFSSSGCEYQHLGMLPAPELKELESLQKLLFTLPSSHLLHPFDSPVPLHPKLTAFVVFPHDLSYNSI